MGWDPLEIDTNVVSRVALSESHPSFCFLDRALTFWKYKTYSWPAIFYLVFRFSSLSPSFLFSFSLFFLTFCNARVKSYISYIKWPRRRVIRLRKRFIFLGDSRWKHGLRKLLSPSFLSCKICSCEFHSVNYVQDILMNVSRIIASTNQLALNARKSKKKKKKGE